MRLSSPSKTTREMKLMKDKPQQQDQPFYSIFPTGSGGRVVARPTAREVLADPSAKYTSTEGRMRLKGDSSDEGTDDSRDFGAGPVAYVSK